MIRLCDYECTPSILMGSSQVPQVPQVPTGPTWLLPANSSAKASAETKPSCVAWKTEGSALNRKDWWVVMVSCGRNPRNHAKLNTSTSSTSTSGNYCNYWSKLVHAVFIRKRVFSDDAKPMDEKQGFSHQTNPGDRIPNKAPLCGEGHRKVRRLLTKSLSWRTSRTVNSMVCGWCNYPLVN